MMKLWIAVKQAFGEFVEDDCMTQAAAIAYYTLFSLPPMLMLVFSIAALAPVPQGAIDRILRKQLGVPLADMDAVPLADTDASGSVTQGTDRARGETGLLESVAQRRGEQVDVMVQFGPLSKIIGGCMLIFTATGVFAQLQYALNRAWEVEPDPDQGGVWSFFFKRLLSLGMIIVLLFLLLVSLVLTAVLEELLRAFQGGSPGALMLFASVVMNNVAAFVMATLIFGAMYLILPDAKMRWRDVVIGSAITAGLFIVGKLLIGWYLHYSQVGSSWGNAAAAMVGLLVWVYCSALSVLYGAELTQVWAKRFGDGIEPARGAVRKVEEKRYIR